MFSCIFMSVPIDVSSIDLLFHGKITHTHCHTRALALTHTRRHCAGFKSVTDCFLPPPHRTLYLNDNQLSVLLAGIFSGCTSLMRLDLSGNELTALPRDLFSGLILLR
jgi:hypothetical protein